MDCSLPGSSVHGILQARILERVAIPFSRGSSQSRDWIRVSCIAGEFFTVWATSEAQEKHVNCLFHKFRVEDFDSSHPHSHLFLLGLQNQHISKKFGGNTNVTPDSRRNMVASSLLPLTLDVVKLGLTFKWEKRTVYFAQFPFCSCESFETENQLAYHYFAFSLGTRMPWFRKLFWINPKGRRKGEMGSWLFNWCSRILERGKKRGFLFPLSKRVCQSRRVDGDLNMLY